MSIPQRAGRSVKWARVAIGLLLAPVLPLIPLAVLDQVVSQTNPFWFVWFIYGGVGVLAAFLLGLPLHLVLQKQERLDWWAYALAGGLIACLASPLSLLFNAQLIERLAFAGLCLAYGVVASVVFWLIVVKGAGVRGTPLGADDDLGAVEP